MSKLEKAEQLIAEATNDVLEVRSALRNLGVQLGPSKITRRLARARRLVREEILSQEFQNNKKTRGT